MFRERQWIEMSNFKRKLFIKYELKRYLLKSLTKNLLLKNTYRYFILYKKSKIIRFSAAPQQRNRCVFTGRSYSLIKFGNYSRFFFRTQSYAGELPGFKRASW